MNSLKNIAYCSMQIYEGFVLKTRNREDPGFFVLLDLFLNLMLKNIIISLAYIV
jgi:hypothetical protein